jgi:YD repeat-containing protein
MDPVIIIENYNESGQPTYQEWDDGFWIRYAYNNRGKIIYSEDSYGCKSTWKYDSKNNTVCYSDTNGYSWSTLERI